MGHPHEQACACSKDHGGGYDALALVNAEIDIQRRRKSWRIVGGIADLQRRFATGNRVGGCLPVSGLTGKIVETYDDISRACLRGSYLPLWRPAFFSEQS